MTERRLIPISTKPHKATMEFVQIKARTKRWRAEKKFEPRYAEKSAKSKEHFRTLKHGEIVRYVAWNLAILYSESVPTGEIHNSYTLKNLRNMIREDVEPWVRRRSEHKDFKLMPYQVARALQIMTMDPENPMAFRIDGGVVRLLQHGEQLTAHHELVKRSY